MEISDQLILNFSKLHFAMLSHVNITKHSKELQEKKQEWSCDNDELITLSLSLSRSHLIFPFVQYDNFSFYSGHFNYTEVCMAEHLNTMHLISSPKTFMIKPPSFLAISILFPS